MRDFASEFTWSFDNFSYNYVTTILGVEHNTAIEAIDPCELRSVLEDADGNTELGIV